MNHWLKYVVGISAVGLTAVAISGFVWRASLSTPQGSGPVIEIAKQDGSPLEFQTTQCLPEPPPERFAATATPQLACNVFLRNTSADPIKALSIKAVSVGADGSTQLRSFGFSDHGFPLPIGRPISSGEETVLEKIGASGSAHNVRLSIEFVEFENGAVWGDVNSERLVHMRFSRATARQVIDFVRREAKTKGAETAVRELGTD